MEKGKNEQGLQLNYSCKSNFMRTKATELRTSHLQQDS